MASAGDACDNCPNDFNPFQDAEVCSAAREPSGGSTLLRLKQVRLRAAPRGTIAMTGVLDTTALGGVDGLRNALRQRSQTNTTSMFFRQGSSFAINLSGAGLMPPGQSIFFPACLSVIDGGGTNGEVISFARRGATNLFNVRFKAQGKTFQPPLASADLIVTLSVSGVDSPSGPATCKVRGRYKGFVSCK